jgi:hypothetical protein
MLRVENIAFLVCDVVPAGSDHNSDSDTADAGEFGDGRITNADVVALFRASLLPNQRPPSGSDLYSAMDAGPEDTPPTCGGNGGLANNDVVLCFRRSLVTSLPRYTRSRGGTCSAALSGGSSASGLAPSAETTAAARLFETNAVARSVSVSAGQPLAGALVGRTTASARPGTAVTVPVRLNLPPGHGPVTLQFAVRVLARGRAPAVRAAPQFTAADGYPAPDLVITEGNSLLLGWLHPASFPAHERALLGHVRFVMPQSARAGHVYVMELRAPSAATADGREVRLVGGATRVQVTNRHQRAAAGAGGRQ